MSDHHLSADPLDSDGVVQAHPSEGGVLRFHGHDLLPAGRLVKSQDRAQWVSLESLRREADVRIDREVADAVKEALETLHEAHLAAMTERLNALVRQFDHAAQQMESAAVSLAMEIARRLIKDADPVAFFDRAASHLQALVPQGRALRLRIHPGAVHQLDEAKHLLEVKGSRHVEVLADETLDDPRSLLVETAEGLLDLSAATQLRRIAESILGGELSNEAAGQGLTSAVGGQA